jgi:DNA-binding XRE family transcriptional regulator
MRLPFSSSVRPEFVSVVLGVAHNPKPVSSVRGIDGASWNNKRLAGVTFGFQVRKHCVETQGNVSINILENAPSWSLCLHNCKYFRPDMAVIFLASLLPGNGEGLAGISGCEDIAVWNKSCWVIG